MWNNYWLTQYIEEKCWKDESCFIWGRERVGSMVAQNTVRMREGKQIFFEILFQIAMAIDVNKCLNQI